MVRLKTVEDIARLRAGGRRLARILSQLSGAVRVGMTTGELDTLARQLIKSGGDEAAFLNYRPAGAPRPYPSALCVSVNDEVVHGLPGERELKPGDVISLDLGLRHQGLFTDMALTVALDPMSSEVERLLGATRQALRDGVARARPGCRLGDIGLAIASVAKAEGLGLVTELGGHGVGFARHEEPPVPNFGKRGQGLELKPGLVLAIEPMFTLGTSQVVFLDDGFTVKTGDGSLAAHFEQTVLITEGEPEILTPFI